jgi:DNA-binding beta-propeller fold protein YncE
MEKNKMKIVSALLRIAIVAILASPAFAQSQPPLKFLQDIPIPGIVNGDFDHFVIDLANNHLFLTGEKQNAVFVMDTQTNKLIHTIKNVDEPHSMLFLPDSQQLWVVAGGDGTIRIFNSKTYAPIETLKSTEGADSSAYDAAKHIFYVVAGGEDAKLDYSLISMYDTTTRKHVGDIKIDSKNIEALALEKNGPKIYANIRDKNQVGVIDREKKTLLTTWTLGDLQGNTPISYDDANQRVFVVGRKPAFFDVLDANTGKIVAS